MISSHLVILFAVQHDTPFCFWFRQRLPMIRVIGGAAFHVLIADSTSLHIYNMPCKVKFFICLRSFEALKLKPKPRKSCMILPQEVERAPNESIPVSISVDRCLESNARYLL